MILHHLPSQPTNPPTSVNQPITVTYMLALRIALRYLFSKKSHNAVNLLSYVSVAGVAIATTAMVIVLSVFNGFSDLAAGKLSQLDPNFLITPSQGKVIDNIDSLISVIEKIDGVETVAPVIREKSLVVTHDGQMPVTMVGLSPEALEYTGMASIIIDGVCHLGKVEDPAMTAYGANTALLSVGVAAETGLRGGLKEEFSIYVPRRTGRINPANPMAAFRGDTLAVSGVYRVEQAEYDTDMVIVPVDVARNMLEYDKGQATGLQVFTSSDVDDKIIAEKMSKVLPESLRVLDRVAQQQQAFNMIAIEKWVTLLMLALILVITAFNIVSAIYILRVEKAGNMHVLTAMGATDTMTRSIFAWQGRLITIAGGVIGLLIGSVITLAQQHLGLIKLQASDMSMLAVEAYPVRLSLGDIGIVSIIVVLVALVCARISTLSSR